MLLRKKTSNEKKKKKNARKHKFLKKHYRSTVWCIIRLRRFISASYRDSTKKDTKSIVQQITSLIDQNRDQLSVRQSGTLKFIMYNLRIVLRHKQ